MRLPTPTVSQFAFCLHSCLRVLVTVHRLKGGHFASSGNTYFIDVLPQRQINSSVYKSFVSKSIGDEYSPVGDFIVRRLKQWNLQTRTAGIEVFATKQIPLEL
jgi:hypothetical protein